MDGLGTQRPKLMQQPQCFRCFQIAEFLCCDEGLRNKSKVKARSRKSTLIQYWNVPCSECLWPQASEPQNSSSTSIRHDDKYEIAQSSKL